MSNHFFTLASAKARPFVPGARAHVLRSLDAENTHVYGISTREHNPYNSFRTYQEVAAEYGFPSQFWNDYPPPVTYDVPSHIGFHGYSTMQMPFEQAFGNVNTSHYSPDAPGHNQSRWGQNAPAKVHTSYRSANPRSQYANNAAPYAHRPSSIHGAPTRPRAMRWKAASRNPTILLNDPAVIFTSPEVPRGRSSGVPFVRPDGTTVETSASSRWTSREQKEHVEGLASKLRRSSLSPSKPQQEPQGTMHEAKPTGVLPATQKYQSTPLTEDSPFQQPSHPDDETPAKAEPTPGPSERTRAEISRNVAEGNAVLGDRPNIKFVDEVDVVNFEANITRPSLPIRTKILRNIAAGNPASGKRPKINFIDETGLANFEANIVRPSPTIRADILEKVVEGGLVPERRPHLFLIAEESEDEEEGEDEKTSTERSDSRVSPSSVEHAVNQVTTVKQSPDAEWLKTMADLGRNAAELEEEDAYEMPLSSVSDICDLTYAPSSSQESFPRGEVVPVSQYDNTIFSMRRIMSKPEVLAAEKKKPNWDSKLHYNRDVTSRRRDFLPKEKSPLSHAESISDLSSQEKDTASTSFSEASTKAEFSSGESDRSFDSDATSNLNETSDATTPALSVCKPAPKALNRQLDTDP